MLPKKLFATLLLLSTLTLAKSSPRTSTRTREDDANTAFDDFTQLSDKLLGDLAFETNKTHLEVTQKLQEMQQETLFSLDKKITDVELKILEIHRNLEALDIANNCLAPTDDLENFQMRLTQRAKTCTELSEKVVVNLIQKTLAEFEMKRHDYLACYEGSLDACKNYAVNDTCFDNVIATLKNGEDSMTGAFLRVVANVKNKLVAFKLPCQEMMEFEVSFFPESLLPPVSACAEGFLRNSRPYTCV